MHQLGHLPLAASPVEHIHLGKWSPQGVLRECLHKSGQIHIQILGSRIGKKLVRRCGRHADCRHLVIEGPRVGKGLSTYCDHFLASPHSHSAFDPKFKNTTSSSLFPVERKQLKSRHQTSWSFFESCT